MARLHQNNFGTNLTSATSAGATTSPLNSIPTIAAPFYIAFDATNINGHYEVLDCTSKTATNVNHAALTYDHTVAEEVRMVVPAVELDSFLTGSALNLAEGQMINGRILPSVASNNLTVALKTLAGADPSATDPVYVMIGGVVRSITSALSVVANAGTNWLNLGSAELATKETDLFVYLGWYVAGGTPSISFSRLPYGNIYSDITDGTTGEKAGRYAGGLDATNSIVNIGRFAATLSAGAGYTWTVPTFTATNLIQRPIYETRWLAYTPTWTGSGSMTVTPAGWGNQFYKVSLDKLILDGTERVTTGGTANTTINKTIPFVPVSAGGTLKMLNVPPCQNGAGAYLTVSAQIQPLVNLVTIIKTAGGNWALSPYTDISIQDTLKI